MDTNPITPINPETNPTSAPVATPANPILVNSNPVVKKSNPFKKWILLILVLLGLVAVAGAGGYFYMNQSKAPEPISMISPTPDPNSQVVCTQDAKECPDGSFVSRQGPTCEFAACPTGNASSAKTYSNTENMYSFNYPSGWKIVSSIPGSSENSVSLAPADWPENEGGAPPISGEYFDNPNNLSIEKWEEEIDKGKQISRGYYIPDAKKTTINGYTAYISDKGNCHPYGCPQVIIVGDKRIFIFQHLGELNKSDASQDVKKYEEVFEEIYTSFTLN